MVFHNSIMKMISLTGSSSKLTLSEPFSNRALISKFEISR